MKKALFLAAFSLPMFVEAQIPGLPAAPEAPKAAAIEDPLGRESPRSSLIRFLRAVEDGRYYQAAQYLQIPASAVNTRGVRLSQELQVLFNSGYTGALNLISDRPEGTDDEGFPANKESIGSFVEGDESVDVVMVRIQDATAGQVWVIAEETLVRVPPLAAKVGGFELAKSVPKELRARFLVLAIYQWIGVAVLLLICHLIAIVGAKLLIKALRRAHLEVGSVPQGIILLVTLFLHSRVIEILSIPLLYVLYYKRVVGIGLLLAITWLLLRAIDAAADRWRTRAVTRGKLAAGSWIVLVRRMLKFLVVGAVGLIILASFGVNVSAALAGVGIGTLAIGFGAQKTIENLFGGVSIASDQVIRVGDTCSLGGRIGTVTDIGLRSTRMRTIERTELSVPNGVLAAMNVENFSPRDKWVFNTKIGVLYQTTPDQLKKVLKDIRELFASHGKLEWPGGRVCMVNFGDSAIEIEIWVYVLTPNFPEFVEIRENLLLRIMEIIQAAGTDFAFPSRTIYVKTDPGGSAELPLPPDPGTP